MRLNHSYGRETFKRRKDRFLCCSLYFEQTETLYSRCISTARTSGDRMSRRATKSRAAMRDARSLPFFLTSVNDKKSGRPLRRERNDATDFVSLAFPPRVAAIPTSGLSRHAGGERRQPTESNGNSFLGNSLPEIYGRNWPSSARSDQRAIHLLESVQSDCASGYEKETGEGGEKKRERRANHHDNDRRMSRGKTEFHKPNLLIPSRYRRFSRIVRSASTATGKITDIPDIAREYHLYRFTRVSAPFLVRKRSLEKLSVKFVFHGELSEIGEKFAVGSSAELRRSISKGFLFFLERTCKCGWQTFNYYIDCRETVKRLF